MKYYPMQSATATQYLDAIQARHDKRGASKQARKEAIFRLACYSLALVAGAVLCGGLISSLLAFA